MPEETTTLRSESFYRHLVENSLGLICSHNFNGELLMVNRAVSESLGYSIAELTGVNLRDLVPPELGPQLDAYLARVRRYGQARGYLDLQTRAGQTLTWLYRNRVYGELGQEPIVIGHAQDITWRLHMERSLRESSERFRMLFEDAPVAYHEIDAEGVILRVNRAECDLLGFSKEEMLGRCVWELVAPEQRQESREQVQLKISGLRPLTPFLREYVRKDGTRVSLHIHERLIKSSRGTTVGIRSTLLDVTPQLRVEAELRRLNAGLDRRVADRTAELNASTERLKEFVYTVSHDLQEPLRTITSFTKLLRTRYESRLDADGVEFLEFVSSASVRMSGLIRDLLAYSRVLHEEPDWSETVNLTEALNEAMDNLKDSIQSAHATVVARELPTIHASPHRIAQLFQNLLGNAIKYSHTPPEIQVWCDRIEGAWMVSVKDSGVGVPAEDRDRIFGLFKRGRRAEDAGSGVGLAICRAIVERHGGRIWVDPAEERGSVFRFTLPSVHRKE